MKQPPRTLLATSLAIALLAAGCGGDGDGPESEPADAVRSHQARQQEQRSPANLRPPACPAELGNCERAGGEIAFVERVDPDGDGDAHFVLLSDESVTGPGITVVDVPADLRPRPLPGPGDLLAAAGPVYPGSFGQRQIEAVAVRVARGR